MSGQSRPDREGPEAARDRESAEDAPAPVVPEAAPDRETADAAPALAAPKGARVRPPAISRRGFLQAAGVAGAHLALGAPAFALPGRAGDGASEASSSVAGPADSEFDVAFDEGGIVGLRRVRDAFDTDYIAPGRRLGDVIVRYRPPGGAWRAFETADAARGRRVDASADGRSRRVVYRVADRGSPGFELRVGFVVETTVVRWSLAVENLSDAPLEIGDLAVPLPMNTNFRRRGQPPTAAVLKHSLVSGDGSFFFWMRRNSVGPYLTMTPDAHTSLEYWESAGGYRVFIHSAVAGAEARERGCDWRQPNTSLTLAPRGQDGSTRRYAFTFRWAADYDDVREILVDEGLIDVQVVPGMTVPVDLFARVALRTKEPIAGIEAEFPDATELRPAGTKGDVRLYDVRFSRLGENRLTVRFGDRRRMHLEFFCTEPVETLVRKRAAFIAGHQHRDPSRWYDGLLAEWNMESRVMLGPDNYDRIRGWRIYAVTCDDPGLSKPAFLAAKNAEFPVQAEVSALDYYIENFVWGGLQRTADETFAYGIYGIPDWKTNRESSDPGRDGRLHLWRIYDYPHIVLMYFSMYRVAKENPQIRTALPAVEYLRRAYGTALAMFTIPWEIERWSAYGTGLYNERVIEQVIDALEAAGMDDHAQRLRLHWERKVRTFVNGDRDLFRSEYAFDSTGFESTHALAKYALEHPDRLRVGRVDEEAGARDPVEAARRFLEKQMAANLFCRGWIETAYYYLGSDYRSGAGDRYTLSYMSQLGGWAVLDYALHHAADPAPYLRLGYASILSSWALMNTGTPESNYGYWYPGEENDGAAGGGFEPAPYGETWLDQPHHRGSWYYACEIDLGYCGALRAAATVLADDPLFGRFCYGGDWRGTADGVEIVPKDGVRKRFHAMLDAGRFHIVLETDRFAAERPISLAEDLSEVRFDVESDNPEAHTARLRVSGPAGRYAVRDAGGAAIAVVEVEDGKAAVAELPVDAGRRPVSFRLRRRVEGLAG
ncbi:MAG TPA: DUF5695 domain-containing protein [Longimicrobiales bacterium]